MDLLYRKVKELTNGRRQKQSVCVDDKME